MASLISYQKFLFQFSRKIFDVPKSLCYINSDRTLFTIPKNTSWLKPTFRISRVSPADLPTELIEDSKFVPLNSEEPKYGPPVFLLLGFSVEEAAKILQLLKELEGEFIEVILCTEDMINLSLWEAVNNKQTNLEMSKIATSLPRICFLSGLTGEEMMMFIDAFPESGLEPPAFAALVPNSADKPLTELIEEIMGDHEMLAIKLAIRSMRSNEVCQAIKLAIRSMRSNKG